MKKIFLTLLLFSSPLWAANALLETYHRRSTTDAPSPVQRRWDIVVSYQGPDVPGDTQIAAMSVAVSTFSTAAQIQSAIVGAIQAEAPNRGFTVPVGNTFMPPFQAQ